MLMPIFALFENIFSQAFQKKCVGMDHGFFKKKLKLILYCFTLVSIGAHAKTDVPSNSLNRLSDSNYPLYLGVTGGYGSTTWAGLVPNRENQNIAMALSTPINVDEGGGVWGLFMGYELIPQFAVELAYTKYPSANVFFSATDSMFYDNYQIDNFVTTTETVSFNGKLMLFIPKTTIRAFSSIGGAGLHRNDILNNAWRITPTFGGGLTKNITPHLMAEVGANYTAGYGEVQLDPTLAYFPFLYSVFLRLAIRF